jgi:hypothetical protein
MSNLSQYRTSLAIFSLGLLWVVSEVVGSGDKPAPLDTATNSIVHRLAKSGDEASDTSSAPYELAVSQADSPAPDANPRADGARPPARSLSPFALDAAAGDSDDETGASAAASEAEARLPPDVGLIHK